MTKVNWLKLYEHSPIDKLASKHIAYYESQSEAFKIMMNAIHFVFTKHKIQRYLAFAEVDAEVGTTHIFLRWRPQYNVPRKSPEYDPEEAHAYAYDYFVEFCGTISGLDPLYSGEMVFSYRDGKNILTKTTGEFDYTVANKQQIPSWFIDHLKSTCETRGII